MITKRKKYHLLPIILFMGLIPLISRLKKVDISYFDFKWSTNPEYFIDLFFYYKSIFIIFFGIYALIKVVSYAMNRTINFKEKYFILFSLSIAFVILSFVFSEYKELALWGYKTRLEGTLVLISYYLMAIYIYTEIKSKESIDYVFKVLMYFVGVISFIGLTQYFGHDFLSTTIGRYLLAPSEYVDKINFNGAPGRVYMTISNPNYVGSYIVLLAPLIAQFFVSSKNRVSSMCYGIFFLVLVMLLAGSESRAGFIGGSVAFILWGIFNFIKTDKKDYKQIGKIVVVVIIFFSMFLFHGNNFSRVKRIAPVSKETETTKSNIIPLEEALTYGNKVYLKYDGKEYFLIQESDLEYNLYEVAKIDVEKDLFRVGKKVKELPDQMDIQTVRIEKIGVSAIVYFNKNEKMVFTNAEDGMYYINSKLNLVKLKEIEYIDSGGREKLGSGRVFIWSRTIPLLKETLFIGKGADVFPVVFPQMDYIGKFKGFGDSKRMDETIVDKPHNTYLLYAVNTGVASLIVYLLINLFVLIELINIYRQKIKKYNDYIVAFIAIIVGYGVVALFNDSSVVVSTIYWAIIGLSIALINIVKKEQVIAK